MHSPEPTLKQMSIRTVVFAPLLLAILLSGCKSRPAPELSDTMTGGAATTQSRPDYVARSSPFGASLSEDLPPPRDSSFANAMAQGRERRGVLDSVYFDYNQAFIRPDERSKLEQVYQYMSANPGARIVVEGHCDWRGTTEYNMALGDRRASSARDYLLQLGLDPSRLEVVSKGDLEADEEVSESQMKLDRRAEFVVIGG